MMNALAILEHIVKNVVPERCHAAKSEQVGSFYRDVLEDSGWAIGECVALVDDWVVERANTGKLRDKVEYVSLSSFDSPKLRCSFLSLLIYYLSRSHLFI
jgi:hypothetical protein